MRTRLLLLCVITYMFLSISYKAIATEHEPNDTKGKANDLELNKSEDGAIGKPHDVDWWQVIIGADGRLDVTFSSSNTQYIKCDIYDYDGITLLQTGNTNSSTTISADGLAAGIYYIKMYAYYLSETPGYSVSAALVQPAELNDIEPNDKKAQAKVLPLNKSKTGHVGYYYDHYRDTADWYKLTTNADGLIHLTAISGNNKLLRIYLYDNNGKKQLGFGSGSAEVNIDADGLAAGTYYVKIICYYNSDFAPYTLSDSLKKYTYANDDEPNGFPYQAKVIAANKTVTGHVGFRYNNTHDTADWWKINYTGSGNLSFTIKNEAWKSTGAQHYYYFELYKDTTKTPIYRNDFNDTSKTVHFSALNQGYYYIKIFPYYLSEFISYSITPKFTQANIAGVSASFEDNSISIKQSGILVLPNPAKNKITVSGVSAGASNYIELMDLNGRSLLKQKPVSTTATIDISNYVQGIYILRYFNGSEWQQVKVMKE